MTAVHPRSTPETEEPLTEPAAARVGFRDAVRFEWTKFRTLRSSWMLAAVLGAGLPVFSVIVAVTESLQPDDTILGASVLGGAALALILAGSLGAAVVTGEYRSGTMLPTLLAHPRRLVLLAAKATVAAAVVFAVTLPSAVVAFLAGLQLLDGDVYATGDAFPALVGVALAITSIAVLGVGIGTIVGHSAGAIIATVVIVIVPGMTAPMLGDHERWLGGASLSGVMTKLTQSSDATHEAVGSLGAWPSLAVVAGYTLATVAAAVAVLRRRDT